jgi:prepilin-type N-terminal cleavage/methylation domain-containing protein
MRSPRAFTLIELLITVAIIAILAVIAVPNFLEAQTRAKVSSAKSSMASLQTALEAYAVDNNQYPYAETVGPDAPTNTYKYLPAGGHPRSVSGPDAMCGGVTSPIAYISHIPDDPFVHPMSGVPIKGPLYYEKAGFGVVNNAVTSGYDVDVPLDAVATSKIDGIGPDEEVDREDKTPRRFVLYSLGPDLKFEFSSAPFIHSAFNLNNRYDPTNGTVSPGNVIRYPGGTNFP